MKNKLLMTLLCATAISSVSFAGDNNKTPSPAKAALAKDGVRDLDPATPTKRYRLSPEKQAEIKRNVQEQVIAAENSNTDSSSAAAAAIAEHKNHTAAADADLGNLDEAFKNHIPRKRSPVDEEDLADARFALNMNLQSEQRSEKHNENKREIMHAIQAEEARENHEALLLGQLKARYATAIYDAIVPTTRDRTLRNDLRKAYAEQDWEKIIELGSTKK
jgi:hypothetical protein